MSTSKNNTFIANLLNDIDRKSRISKNPSLFILDRNLVEYPMTKMHASELPTEAYFGTIYLIKGKTIFQFTTRPVIKTLDIRMSSKYVFSDGTKNECMVHETIVNTHNVFIGDLNEFTTTSQFENMDDMESHDLQKTHNFMMALIKNKFKIYKSNVTSVSL